MFLFCFICWGVRFDCQRVRFIGENVLFPAVTLFFADISGVQITFSSTCGLKNGDKVVMRSVSASVSPERCFW